jgi:hypothetical protein
MILEFEKVQRRWKVVALGGVELGAAVLFRRLNLPD